MRNLINLNMILLIAVGYILTGCVSTTKEISRTTNSSRTDVFVEVPAEGTAPVGFVDLVIKASIKTPDVGRNVPDAEMPGHKISGYPFLLNIDGQAVRWTAVGQKETLPLYDKDGYASRNPDAGDGIRYRLEKKIRLAAGLHRIYFGLPQMDYLSAFKVVLIDGGSQVLEFKPRYRFITHPSRMPVFVRTTFLQGIKRYDAVLNGQVVSAVVADYASYGFKVFLPEL